jgi:3-hydroxyacyl-CoA dehydrogenase/enoyl-CoA hydratase/3-hydroxybutyryl-CoA epimerase
MFEGLRFSHWKAETDAEGILVLTFDRAGASVNTFARAVRDELGQIVERLSFNRLKASSFAPARRPFTGADIHK